MAKIQIRVSAVNRDHSAGHQEKYNGLDDGNGVIGCSPFYQGRKREDEID